MKKTLMIAAATLALATGAAGLQSTTAEAGYKGGYKNFHFKGHGYKHFNYHYKPRCYTEYQQVKVKVWSHKYYDYIWTWESRPVKRCY